MAAKATVSAVHAPYIIDLLARLAGRTQGQVVEWLEQTKMPSDANASNDEDDQIVKVYSDYGGHRTSAAFNRLTARVDIVDGPLAGQSFRAPSGAAAAVVTQYNPKVSPHRNGWHFWVLDDGSGKFLASLRGD